MAGGVNQFLQKTQDTKTTKITLNSFIRGDGFGDGFDSMQRQEFTGFLE
jgi:hypothetical protein